MVPFSIILVGEFCVTIYIICVAIVTAIQVLLCKFPN